MTRFAFLISLALVTPAAAQDDFGAALRSQIAPCWNATALADVDVYIWTFVSFDLDRQGKVIEDEVVWQESRGGSIEQGALMFESIRRAVLRCGRDGFDLPAGRYEEWREVNVAFAINGEN